MSAAITHVAYTAAFTPTGGSAWNMTDLMDLSDSEDGDITELTTDASQVVNGMFSDNIKGEITVTCANLAHSTDAGAVIGAVGSLVIKYAKRSAGKGNVSSNYLAVTYANAVVRSVRRQGGVTGHGTFVVAFGAYGTDGAAVATKAVGS